MTFRNNLIKRKIPKSKKLTLMTGQMKLSLVLLSRINWKMLMKKFKKFRKGWEKILFQKKETLTLK
jgi:hypothetical protein